jgi:hypothetical protein
MLRSSRCLPHRFRPFMGGEVEERYEEVRVLGQVVKGDEEFARVVFRHALEPETELRWLTEGKVASATAKAVVLKVAQLRAPGRYRDLSQARAVAACVAKRSGVSPLIVRADTSAVTARRWSGMWGISRSRWRVRRHCGGSLTNFARHWHKPSNTRLRAAARTRP